MRGFGCLPLLMFVLGACEGEARNPSDAGSVDTGLPDAGAPDTGLPDAGRCELAETVTLTTEDGVTLEADALRPAGEIRGAVALFHMIPPFNTRGNYPAELLDALTERGLAVLNVDRRGAGGSEGDPVEAYEGPAGRLDVLAAVQWLVDDPCVPDVPYALVGASNGTTSVLDFTVDPGAVSGPSAIAFLTGGGYTENQNAIADHRDALDPLPLLFLYSTEERAWSAAFEADGSASWRFEEVADGAHGTNMFGAAPATIELVADFLADAL
ncbi:MAG: CocE/NonD family hydrolase [Sandaracinaceae bacterium]